jgi:outer membrane protein
MLYQSLTFFLYSVWFLFPFENAKAQEILDLDKAIQIALENNIDIKRAENFALRTQTNELQSKYNFLPDLNANLDYNILYGTTFDNANGTLINTTTRGSSPRISSELVVYNGLSNHHNLKRNKLLVQAADYGIENEKDIVRITIVGLFLQVLTDQENMSITLKRIALLEEQLIRARKRVEAGVDNLQQVYNLESQLAAENLNLVNQENQLKRDRLRLLQTIQVDPTQEYEIERIELEENLMLEVIENYQATLNLALGYSPALKQSELLINSAEKNLLISKSSQYPYLTLSGALGSRYSSNGAFDPEVGAVVSKPYFQQLDVNQYEYVALNMRIPIFNRFQVKNNIQMAKIDIADARLDYQDSYNQLVNRIQEAYLELLSARSTYLAASENLNALENSYQFAKSSYEAGRMDFYSYLESLNNKNQAEIDLVISKYSFVLRNRILEIYEGE